MEETHNDEFYNFLMEDDSDDEDQQRVKLLIFLAAISNDYTSRKTYYVRDRIEWDAHVAKLNFESPKAFLQMYRMDLASFNKLCSWLDPFLSVDPVMSRVRTGKGAIVIEVVLHCLLRWLAGGSHLDIRIMAGISVPSFFTCIHKCVHAVLQCNQLAIKFPRSVDEIEQSAKSFRNFSTDGVIDGCVACLDGMLLPIQTPSSTETGNVMAYYSGHYAEYGLNIQAACDSMCRFVYVSVAAPGSTSDIVALRKTSLSRLIEALPLGKYVLGDNAYVCTEHLLTPFPGDQRRQPQNDTYNYHLSQLRIRIEMTFGRFMNQWRLFKRPLQVNLKNAGKVYMCAARLFNFCANERLIGSADANTMAGDITFEHYISSDTTERVEGNSMMRDILVNKIYHSGLSRPSENRQRNRG